MWDELWDEVDWDAISGGDPDFSELPLGDMPTFDQGLEMESYYGDPYADWGGGAEGDGSEIFKGGAGGMGEKSWLEQIFGAGKGAAGLLGKGAGGLFGGGGGMDLTSLLAALGMGYGGYKGNQASKESAEEIKAAAKEANANAAGLIGGAQGNFQPYIDAGKSSVADLYALTQQPGLASKFGPLKAKAGPKMKGSVSLAELAGK
jgi:hypothetical protein